MRTAIRVFASNTHAITMASATDIGGRPANADAVHLRATPLGAGAAVVDGIGSSPATVDAAQLAAVTAATVAVHRGAQAGIMAAADTMPDYPGTPNAVAAVVSVDPDGRIEIAHVGDAAVWTWTRTGGLQRWTVEQTVGQHIAHMLTNPALTDTDRELLVEQGARVAAVMDDYLLNGLAQATVSTIAWTPLRGERADLELILLTSDGVHKALTATHIAELAAANLDSPDALATALVKAAVIAKRRDGQDSVDNATAAVLRISRPSGEN